MLGLGGQLGRNSLGVFELAAVQTGTVPFVPHRGRVNSRLFASTVHSADTGDRIGSTLSAAKTKAEVTSE